MSRNRYRFRVRLMNSLRKLTSESVVVRILCWRRMVVLHGAVAFVAVVDARSTAGYVDSSDFSGVEVQVWEW